ncbi:hypothetical protein LX36DRAFT_468156 [Colletotrichum falcatum]|nr:hypothetical protein LX36DRAFT_468156 [Colletotrichum falcatum]
MNWSLSPLQTSNPCTLWCFRPWLWSSNCLGWPSVASSQARSSGLALGRRRNYDRRYRRSSEATPELLLICYLLHDADCSVTKGCPACPPWAVILIPSRRRPSSGTAATVVHPPDTTYPLQSTVHNIPVVDVRLCIRSAVRDSCSCHP